MNAIKEISNWPERKKFKVKPQTQEWINQVKAAELQEGRVFQEQWQPWSSQVREAEESDGASFKMAGRREAVEEDQEINRMEMIQVCHIHENAAVNPIWCIYPIHPK